MESFLAPEVLAKSAFSSILLAYVVNTVSEENETMSICSNCGTEFLKSDKDSLLISQSVDVGIPVEAAALCFECLDGAKVIKLVLKRNLAGQFAYEQFSVLEMENRAFGKTA